ncbi:hypothetical protein FRB94_000482 [Tulasnella sp. JGI-2019a]|nr:hypothetical protein FRB94_000482 [Tulasnella sp. JGI-2019a]KAG8992621.1 hypothetical protein FRB93_002353 [Tulasnella sp. JGI-2019a]
MRQGLPIKWIGTHFESKTSGTEISEEPPKGEEIRLDYTPMSMDDRRFRLAEPSPRDTSQFRTNHADNFAELPLPALWSNNDLGGEVYGHEEEGSMNKFT